jgi:hypothetical protein
MIYGNKYRECIRPRLREGSVLLGKIAARRRQKKGVRTARDRSASRPQGIQEVISIDPWHGTEGMNTGRL